MLSQPKAGSVEWHFNEYRAAAKEQAGARWKHRVEYMWNRILGTPVLFEFSIRAEQRRREHQRALIKLGYLEERLLVFSNRTADEVLLGRNFETVRTNLLKFPALRQAQWEFIDVIPGSSDYRMILVAPPQARPALEQFLREADVP